METKLATAKKPEDIWTRAQVDTIRNTVAIGANDNELSMFLNIAAKYELDPFLREIWFANMGNRNTIMTGRDGYLKIANRDPNFDGMKSDVIHANDKFLKDGDDVKHAYNMQNRGAIVGAYAIVYRKDRTHPTFCYAPFAEYNKGGRGVWGQYPSAMIIKVAETMALKRAFSISGLVTEEEIGDGEAVKSSTVKKNGEIQQKNRLTELWQRFCAILGADEARSEMQKITGKTNSAEYTQDDIMKLAVELERLEKEKTAKEAESAVIEVEEIPTEVTANAESENS